MQSISPWSMVEFRAMGSSCRIVAPDAELARHGQVLVEELEQAWSRFVPDSEISRVNAHAGSLSIVSAVTYELISVAERARRATAGAFNPLMLDHLIALGYDRSWETMVDSSSSMPPAAPGAVAAIELFPEVSAIRLPAGTRFDPGGIGKGLAGDMVAAALLAAGAESVQIELGGDVRVAGPAWDGGVWRVELDDVDHGVARPASVAVAGGGVATSSVMRRRWSLGGVRVHHLLDASTGLPALSDLDSVTAVAPTLWWAEVVAKTALIAGRRRARSLLEHHSMTGVLVGGDTTDRYEVVHSQRMAA